MAYKIEDKTKLNSLPHINNLQQGGKFYMINSQYQYPFIPAATDYIACLKLVVNKILLALNLMCITLPRLNLEKGSY